MYGDYGIIEIVQALKDAPLSRIMRIPLRGKPGYALCRADLFGRPDTYGDNGETIELVLSQFCETLAVDTLIAGKQLIADKVYSELYETEVYAYRLQEADNGGD